MVVLKEIVVGTAVVVPKEIVAGTAFGIAMTVAFLKEIVVGTVVVIQKANWVQTGEEEEENPLVIEVPIGDPFLSPNKVFLN